MILQSAPPTDNQKDFLKVWAADIGAQVAAGKNVKIFHQFRIGDKYNRWPSMKKMLDIVCAMGGIDMTTDTVMHYDGMDGAEKKRILSDININWKIRVVMTITTITAGVDFNAPDWLDRLFTCISEFQNPREVVQRLSCARHIREDKVYVVKIFPQLKV